MIIRVADLPPLTLALTIACAGVSAAAALGKCAPSDLALSFTLILRGQLWRLLTPFGFVDGLSMRFMAHLYFVSHFSALLESGYYAGRVHHYAATLAGGLAAMLAGCYLAPDLEQPFLLMPLSFFIVYLWSVTDPEQTVEIFSALRTTGGNLPWWLLGGVLVAGGVPAAMPCLLGLGAGVFVDCVRDGSALPAPLPVGGTSAAVPSEAQGAGTPGTARGLRTDGRRGIVLAAVVAGLVSWQLRRAGMGGSAASARHAAQCAQLRWALEVDAPFPSVRVSGPNATSASQAAGSSVPKPAAAAGEGSPPGAASAAAPAPEAAAADLIAELIERALAAAPLAQHPNASASPNASSAQAPAEEAAAGASDAQHFGPPQILALFESLSVTWRSKQKAHAKPALSSASSLRASSQLSASAAALEGADADAEAAGAEASDEALAAMQTQLVDALAQYDVPESMQDAEVLENVLGEDQLADVPGYSAFAAHARARSAARERAGSGNGTNATDNSAAPSDAGSNASSPSDAANATANATSASAPEEAGPPVSVEMGALLEVVSEHRHHQLVARAALASFKQLAERLRWETEPLEDAPALAASAPGPGAEGEPAPPGDGPGAAASGAAQPGGATEPPPAAGAGGRASDLLSALRFDPLGALEVADVRRLLNATVCSFTVPQELSDADVLAELVTSAEPEGGNESIPELHRPLLHAIIGQARAGMAERARSAAVNGLTSLLAAPPPPAASLPAAEAAAEAGAAAGAAAEAAAAAAPSLARVCLDPHGAQVACEQAAAPGASGLAPSSEAPPAPNASLAGAFNFTERMVLQALVFDLLNGLPPPLIAAESDGELHARVLQMLAIAAPAPSASASALAPSAPAGTPPTPAWNDSLAVPPLRPKSLGLLWETVREHSRQQSVQRALVALKTIVEGGEALDAAQLELEAAAEAEAEAAAEATEAAAEAAEAAEASAAAASSGERVPAQAPAQAPAQPSPSDGPDDDAEVTEVPEDSEDSEDSEDTGDSDGPAQPDPPKARRAAERAAAKAARKAALRQRLDAAARSALETHVNASLAGFDVPGHMSDREVLRELLKMAPVEAEAIAAGRLEMIRAAIKVHRKWLADVALAEAAAAIAAAGGGSVTGGDGGAAAAAGDALLANASGAANASNATDAGAAELASRGPWLPELGSRRASELLDSWKLSPAKAKAPLPSQSQAARSGPGFRASPSEFAVVLAAALHRAGVRHVRLAVLCVGANSSFSTQHLQAPEQGRDGELCHAVTEVRLGKSRPRIQRWVADHRRLLKPRSKGRVRGAKEVHYRSDRKGYFWLSLRWVHRPEEVYPGMSLGEYDSAVTYYPTVSPPRWEIDGELLTSRGELKLQRPPIGSILSAM